MLYLSRRASFSLGYDATSSVGRVRPTNWAAPERYGPRIYDHWEGGPSGQSVLNTLQQCNLSLQPVPEHAQCMYEITVNEGETRAGGIIQLFGFLATSHLASDPETEASTHMVGLAKKKKSVGNPILIISYISGSQTF